MLSSPKIKIGCFLCVYARSRENLIVPWLACSNKTFTDQWTFLLDRSRRTENYSNNLFACVDAHIGEVGTSGYHRYYLDHGIEPCGPCHTMFRRASRKGQPPPITGRA